MQAVWGKRGEGNPALPWLHFDHLVLLGGELKDDVLSGQLLVHSGKRLELVLCGVALLRVKVDLEDLSKESGGASAIEGQKLCKTGGGE